MIEQTSPNFDERKVDIDLLLLHYTGMRSAEEALLRLTDAAAKVSAHYLVDEDGTIYKLVDEDKRAWHAGVASWQGNTDINGCSVGIEIVNPGHEFGYRAFPDAQMKAVIALSQEITARHNIPKNRIIGHSDVAPTRKHDPGELFDWKGLAQVGLGVWYADDFEVSTNAPIWMPGMMGPQVTQLQFALNGIGYSTGGTGFYEQTTKAAVKAFQRHWRPAKVDGIVDAETHSALYHILDQMNAAL